jgi:hypothetical protein
MATLAMVDGFEHGRNAIGVGGVYDAVSTAIPNIVTSPVRTGLRAMEISAVAAAENIGYNVATNFLTMSFYLRFETLLPTADVILIVLSNANGTGKMRFLNSTDTLEVQAGSGPWVSTGQVVVTGVWYRVTMEYDTSGASAVLRAKVDANAEVSSTGVQASANTTVARLGTNVAETFTAYYDDWLISVTDGDYEEIRDWASHSVESLIPTADGTHNITASGDFDSFTGTAFSNATTNGNTFIGHRPLQAANTANQVIRQGLGTTANYMEFLLENLSGGTDTPIGVRAYATHIESATTGASLAKANLMLADDTVVLTTGALSVISTTEDPGTTVSIRKRMTITPAGGWDRTKVDGLKARVGFGDNAPDVNFIDFMVEVALIPAVVGATSYPFSRGRHRRSLTRM